MEQLFGFLATYALHSTLFLAAAWVFGRVCGEARPDLAEVAWKVASVAGLASASLAISGFGIASQTLAIGEPLQVAAGAVGGDASIGEMAAPVILATIWLGGAVLSTLRLAMGRRALGRLLRDREPAEDGRVAALASELSDAAGLSSVRVSASDALGSPVALGWREVCLPTRVTELSGPQLRCLLGHEFAHLARRDPGWLVFLGVLEAVFFFQPLHRVARRSWEEHAELICDGWAVRSGGLPTDMAHCLAEVGRWIAGRSHPTLATSLTRRPSPLVARVKRLLDGRLPRQARARHLVGGLAVAVLLGAAVPPVSGAADSARLGALDKALIDDGVRQDLSGIRSCYQAALKEDASLAGEVAMKFTIQPDGSVADAGVRRSTLGSETAEGCITQRIEKLQFPRPKGNGVVIVSYPFVFSSE